MSFGDESLNILNDHDGIIHNDSDGKHEAKKGEVVQRESKSLHDRHRADE